MLLKFLHFKQKIYMDLYALVTLDIIGPEYSNPRGNEAVIGWSSRPLDPSQCETTPTQNELEQNYLQMFRLSVLHQM